jgi:hydrophobic/amphiphilic exporter-1 (mainly G- bacteria), HAE1 family
MVRLSIRRPVAVAMGYMALTLLGVFAWRNIPLELLPDTQLPRLSVSGSWPGSSPEVVEAFLTSPLESAIQQVQGVERIVSDSREGAAAIQIEFTRETDMDFARLDLSERLSALEEDFPPGVRSVTVRPYVPREFEDQTRPVLRYSFTGPYTLEALHRHLEDIVAPELGQVRGVALAEASGGRERRLEIRVDENRARSLGLSATDVAAAIRDLDLVREAGVVREAEMERAVTIINRATSADEVRQALVTTADGTAVRVGDVASVHDTFEESRQLERINGRPSVTLTVRKEPAVNTVRVADAVKARLAELERLSPYGTSFVLEDDLSEDIRRQLTDLRSRAAVAALVIFVVLLGFLRSFRSAAVVFATIAFSVLISLNLIYFGGLTLNLLTLMGLAMGFGLIVDNSIVVLENVFRRWQRGEAAGVAAEEGTREVVLPILASTATTLIVFVPFVYLQGELRVFYVPLAIVVGLTLLASLFVAFSFIPALASKLLTLGGERTRTASDANSLRRPPLYLRFYEGLVGLTVRFPWAAVVVTVACFAVSWHFFDTYVTKGRVWGGGFGGDTYIDVRVTLPRGSNLERTDQLVTFFEDKLAELPDVEQYTSTVTETFGRIRVTFPDSLELTGVPVAIKEQMVAYSHTFTGADVRVYGFGPSFYGGGGSPPTYTLTVLGYNYNTVREIAEDLGRRLARVSRVQEVDTNASGGFTRDRAVEYAVHIDRTALARYDMSVQSVMGQLQAAVAGEAGGATLKLGGEEVRLGVKVADVDKMDVLALRETIIQIPGGRGIRLGDVVSIVPRDVLSSIRRENQQYERSVAYEFRGPSRLGDAYRDAILAATVLPPGYSIKPRDFWRFSSEQRAQIFMVLAVSIVLVYMVTAALFESLRQPLCVLLTVPMALIGVFMMFFYTQATFTREAYVGVIMMGGIVVNNAILLVDHINRVRATSGLPLDQAILRGTLERVRPILMTTTTTVLGLLPLVLFSAGADSTIWNALAFTLIGGLLSSTLFVLTTTPALYHVFERGPARRAAVQGRAPVGFATPSSAAEMQ